MKHFNNWSERIFLITFFACPISWAFIESTNAVVITLIVIINLICGINLLKMFKDEQKINKR